MAFLNALQKGALSSLATPPAPKPSPQVGSPPPPNPNAAPPPYDSAHDPAWKGILDTADHAMRNFLNGLDADTREMLRQKMMKALATPPPTAAPTFPPMQNPFESGARIPPIASTSRAPGTI